MLSGRVVKVSLQSGHEVPKLDDVVVDFDEQDPSCRVLVQSKLSLSFTASDTEFAETIAAIHGRIMSDAPQAERYAIAFQHNANDKKSAMQQLIDFARGVQTPQDWMSRVISEPRARAMADVLVGITGANLEQKQHELYMVCHRTVLWHLELIDPGFRDLDETLLCLAPYVRGVPENRRLFWNTLVDLASRRSTVRGYYTRAEILSDRTIRSLYKQPVEGDPVANVIGAEWFKEQDQRVQDLRTQLHAGRAYESSVEVEELLFTVRRLQSQHPADGPSAPKLAELMRRLLLVQGRALLLLDYRTELVNWINSAKQVADSNPELWAQIGRVAVEVNDFGSVEEACAFVTDPSKLSLLRARQALLENDEAKAWELIDHATGDEHAEAFGVRAERLIENLNGEPNRLMEAIRFAESYATAFPKRPLAWLLYASALYLAIMPGASPLYEREAHPDLRALGERLASVDAKLRSFLEADLGLFEKFMAFNLELGITAVLRNPNLPRVAVLEDVPAFLERADTGRTIAYAQAMLSVGMHLQAEQSLRRKLTKETDSTLRASLQKMLLLCTGEKQVASDSVGYLQSRNRLYQRYYLNDTKELLQEARQLLQEASGTAFAVEAGILLWLAGGETDLEEAVSALTERFPGAIESINAAIDALHHLYRSTVGPGERTLRELAEDKDPKREAMSRCLMRLCRHVCAFLPSEHCLAIWMEVAINADDTAELEDLAAAAKTWDLSEMACLSEGWVALSRGDFQDAADLIDRYGTRYRQTAHIRNLRDQCLLQAESYRRLADTRAELLQQKDRLPGTARYTVQALVLIGDSDAAIEVAKANVDDFPDDKVALRDFIFLATQLHRLDAISQAVERFFTLFPDDKFLWKEDVQNGADIIGKVQKKNQELFRDYEQVKLPINFLGRPLIEKWLQLLSRAEGVQARRLGLQGPELSEIDATTTLALDITALLAASKFRLWSRLSGVRLITDRSSVHALREDLRVMRLQVNEAEYKKHERYQRLLKRQNVIVYKTLPAEAVSSTGNSEPNLGQLDMDLWRWLGVPLISTHGEDRSERFRLQDLLLSLLETGRARPLMYEEWLDKLRSSHPLVYADEPLTITGFSGSVMMDDIDLRGMSEAGIADAVLDKLDRVILGPASVFSNDLLSGPHLWQKEALEGAERIVADVEAALKAGNLEERDLGELSSVDEIDYLEGLARLAKEAGALWCDDTMVRSVVAHECGAPTISTYQIIRHLRNAGRIDDYVYRDLIGLQAAAGFRDIDGADALTACVADTCYRPSQDVRRAAYHLGRTMKAALVRSDGELDHSQRLALRHVEALIVDAPDGADDLIRDVCEAVALGAQALSGAAFWPLLLEVIRHRVSSQRLMLVELAASDAGQLDLARWTEREAERLAKQNRVKFLSVPTICDYLRSLRGGTD